MTKTEAHFEYQDFVAYMDRVIALRFVLLAIGLVSIAYLILSQKETDEGEDE